MSIYSKASLAVLTILLFSIKVSAQRNSHDRVEYIPLTKNKNAWVDSVYNKLTPDERIGQLFMLAAYSGGKNYNEDQITQLLANHQLGGLIFMQGGPVKQALLTNRYQHMAQVPLLIGMDAEWGVGMRLDSVKPFPREMMMGATRDTALVFRVGAAIAYQCKRLGVNIDFAPVVDINNNPLNPVINSRSFGEDKYWVARLGVAIMRGLQSNGIIACAKHFPGHGNTDVDSHKDLPFIQRQFAQLDTMELYPFRQLIASGVKSVMIAHLEVPAIEPAAHVPSTLSKKTVTDLLKNKLGFKGLVITDALNMEALTKYFPAGIADMMAFDAGNDIILFPQDVPMAIAKIKEAMAEGLATPQMLETSVKKILGAKYDAGLAKWKDIDITNIADDLNKVVDPMRVAVTRSAITLVSDENQVLNKITYTMSIAYVGINTNTVTPLYKALNDKFDNVKAIWLPRGTPLDSAQRILDDLSNYDAVILGVHNLVFTPGGNYGLSNEAIAFLQYAGCRNNTMVALLGNAYAMQFFCGSGSVLVGYEDDTTTERIMAEVLLKKIKPKGKLPVTACLAGKSVCPVTLKLPVLVNEPAYKMRNVMFPPDAGVVNMKALDKLDMFMARCVANGVFPGCRILASRNGKIFYDKAFGYYKYDKRKKVELSTIYDMASCTKILATTLSIMRLYEQGKVDLNKTLADYLPAAKGTNKADLKIKDIMLHQAGLRAGIPFIRETSGNGDPGTGVYSHTQHDNYTIQNGRDLYMRKDYIDTLWTKIYQGGLENTGRFVYSDVDFFLLAAIVEQITGKTIDKYVDEQFYKPMGLKRITYLPLKKFDSTQIAPTEIDLDWRKQLLHGYVHDPSAAMVGGVAGHAGIFASAEDVAVIMQMLLNKGKYGKVRYFKSATVDMFTAYHSTISHRGLGFDKPATDPDDGGPAGDRCSGLAFGHQGYTGTCTWADPANGVIFVFLSNRVYPTSENNKINKLSVRTTAQDFIYEALGIPLNHDRPEVYHTQLKAYR